jgi:hypothetical protein
MCFHGEIEGNEFYQTRNGSVIATKKLTGETFQGTVIRSTDRKFPVGHQVIFKSDMGHVRCKGSNDHSCEMHPLDAVDHTNDRYLDRFGWKADRAIAESLRRRRYNVSRAGRSLVNA